MSTITAHIHDDRTLTARADTHRTLEQALFLAGGWSDVPLCAGLGRCGLCRVRFSSSPPTPRSEELKRFSPDELEAGWRLACLHPAVPCELEVPEPPGQSARTARHEAHEPGAGGPILLAVDLGTTSIQWTATSQGTAVAQGSALNPQLGLGSEVMARLAFAATPGGADTLRSLVLDHLREIAASLPGPVESLAISGNPAMAALLLGLPTTTLAAAPYSLPERCGREFELAPDLPRAYVPPLFSPFVGADLSAGLAALHMADTTPEPPFLLADLGTNGEFILELGERRLAASVPMGPALEGVGLSCGRTAAPGVATAFRLTPQGLSPVYGLGPGRDGPGGMTGTGSLSLCALLLRNGLLEPSGRFAARAPDSLSPLVRALAGGLTTVRGEPAFRAAEGVHLTATDVEEILKVKAAFNLAFSRLLAEADLRPGRLASLVLAGAMGEHVNLDDLERLGFIPSGMSTRTVRAGNTSLAGTMRCLDSPDTRAWLDGLPNPQLVDLAADADFSGLFIERMVFSHVA